GREGKQSRGGRQREEQNRYLSFHEVKFQGVLADRVVLLTPVTWSSEVGAGQLAAVKIARVIKFQSLVKENGITG
ncbi:MAG: hypothetical protein WBL39_24970, partial [Terrimicrobiaceae bacterium]